MPTIRPISALTLGCVSVLASCASGGAGSAVTAPSDPDRALHALLDAAWEDGLRDNPTYASQLGDRRYNDRWEDLSPQAIEARHAQDRARAESLARIDRAALSRELQLDYDLFKQNVEWDLERHRLRLYLLPVNQREGLQTADELADALRFTTRKDYDDWLERLRGFGTYADQTIVLLREGARAGVVWPKVAMLRVPAQIDKQIVDDPLQSPFYAPFRVAAPSVPPAEREPIAAEARLVIARTVVPAFRRFRDFFTKEYLPACQDRVGLQALPDGAATYEALVRHHTTTTLSPRAIHELGLREVERITLAMNVVMQDTGKSTTLPQFFAFLRSDRRFYYTDPAELLAGYAAIVKRVDPQIGKIIGTLPRTPYGIEAIPANVAPDTTTAYYRPPAEDGSRGGTFFVNLYKPESRPTWEMVALTLHEAVPGHHIQIALANEQTRLPKFRRHTLYTAFVEGWGLYAESLGDELGMYDDPYAKFGQLAYEMWRAVRLVVDTGMHAMGWDRQRAIDFFREHTPRQELDVVNEIDRYLVMPGQALAYKVGELKIKELRRRAERVLGARFDERAFHDAVLGHGALPLDVLEREVDAWIASQG